MEISFGRDLILSLAGKQIRGEAFTSHERSFLEMFASMPGFKNPIKIECSKCRENLILLADAGDTPPQYTFERKEDGHWVCVRCSSRAHVGQVHIH